MRTIACLHTADSNVAVFDDALRTLGLEANVALRHVVRAELLADAEAAGGLTPEIAERTRMALQSLCERADVVLLTCSTLGPSITAASAADRPPMIRVDAALAQEAVRDGGRVVALCAVETTVAPTRALFEEAARATGAQVDVRLVPGAWAAFRSGDRDGYLQMIAAAADQALREGAQQVALAQASMAGAAQRATLSPRPLSSPLVGLMAASRR